MMRTATPPTPLTLLDGTLEDCACALMSSFDRLNVAANSAIDLLAMAGFAGTRGDTADDLSTSLAMHWHLLHQFNIKVRSAAGLQEFNIHAPSASIAFKKAEDRQGDEPCGITVNPAEPDAASLAAAHKALGIIGTLDYALKDPSLKVALHSFARKRRQRGNGVDLKRLAANDRD